MKAWSILLSFLLLVTGSGFTSVENIELRSNDEVNTESLYIDFIEKFGDNDSFYAHLYFKEGFDYNQYDELVQTGEEVVYSDEETKRTLIPFEKVSQYFQLDALSSITIYNKNNQNLTTGQFSHIEYFEDVIDYSFIAVFDVDEPDIEGYTFFTSNSKKPLNPISYAETQDDALKSKLLTYLNKQNGFVWNTVHYKMNQSVYSAISMDTTAYIIETKGNNHKTLYTSPYGEAITALTFISKNPNGQPVLLTNSGKPETDMTWSSVLLFNGTEYKLSKDHTVRE